jgi:hypothetical protein
MIGVPRTDLEISSCAKFMRDRCRLTHTNDTRYIAWLGDYEGAKVIHWCVAFEGWLGASARIHMAAVEPGQYCPKALVRTVFDFAFNHAKLQVLVGIVNGAETHVMRFDKWLGFKEALRLPGAHEDGHDMVILTMWRHDCRFLEKAHGRKKLTTPA